MIVPQGEQGTWSLQGPRDEKTSVTDFRKKFRDKTKNNWDDRATFTPSPGKYTLLEMDEEGEEEVGSRRKGEDWVEGGGGGMFKGEEGGLG